MAGRKRCEYQGCRKLAPIKGSIFCESHQNGQGKRAVEVTEEQVSVEEAQPVIKHVTMEELERLQLAALDAEMRNAGQGIKILDLEWERTHRDFLQQQQIFVAKKTALVEKFNDRKKHYNQLITELGIRYDIDPKHMTFDTETGILRSLPQNA